VTSRKTRPKVPRLFQPVWKAISMIGASESRSSALARSNLAGFLRGLEAFGYVDGNTATIEYRWANGQYDQLPKLASELTNLHPAIIAAPGGTLSARAAKLATSSIPVFFATSDSVQEGLVASLNRPGGNVTGVDIMSGELTGKRLEFLAQLVPSGGTIAFLTNPRGGQSSFKAKDFERAANALGRAFVVVDASADTDFDSIFSSLAEAKLAVWSTKTIPSSTLVANISSESQRSARFRRFIIFANFRRPGD
jgi:putative tryptophan/tyrosine transport system substrate-binding protein